MTDPKSDAAVDGDTATSLPKLVVVREGPKEATQGWATILWRFRFLPLVMALIFFGGIVGLYFQPPGLRKVFEVFKLEPGGGTSTPIAIPVLKPKSVEQNLGAPHHVVGLGKLIPLGDVTTLSPPFGAGDARIAAINVKEGDKVEAGAILATLDNKLQIEAVIDSSHAVVISREASLAQVRNATRASREEAQAALARARATLANAEQDFARTDDLAQRGITTRASADQKRTARDEGTREVERLSATLSRFTSVNSEEQPDVIVALRSLDAAKADLQRAEQDLEKAYVRAPLAGTVLTIHVRPGEKPGTKGVLNMGDIEHMTAEIEVYQTQIGHVAIGDVVERPPMHWEYRLKEQ